MWYRRLDSAQPTNLVHHNSFFVDSAANLSLNYFFVSEVQVICALLFIDPFINKVMMVDFPLPFYF